MLKKIWFYALIGFALIGILTVSIFVHELVHLIGGTPPYGICLGYCTTTVNGEFVSAFATAQASAYNPYFYSHEWAWMLQSTTIFAFFFLLLPVWHHTTANIETLTEGKKC